MNELRWCCRCQTVSRLPDARTSGHVLTCPNCGADCSQLQTWDSIRAGNPHWPAHPKPGKAYRIRHT